MEILGYSSEWIETGIVTEEEIRIQNEEFILSDDKNQEHYRYQAFTRFLQRTDLMSDSLFKQICGIKDSLGGTLQTNRIIGMVCSKILTDDQLNFLLDSPEYYDTDIKKYTLRELGFRKLKNQPLTDELFTFLQTTDDQVLQEKVFEMNGLTRDYLIWFVEHGLTKKIRNIAKSMLNRR